MSRNQTICLDISPDADFFPVLEKSVSDFADSLSLPEAAAQNLGREAGDFFKRGLDGFDGSSLHMELGLADGFLFFSAYDSGRNRLFSRNIPVA